VLKIRLQLLKLIGCKLKRYQLLVIKLEALIAVVERLRIHIFKICKLRLVVNVVLRILNVFCRYKVLLIVAVLISLLDLLQVVFVNLVILVLVFHIEGFLIGPPRQSPFELLSALRRNDRLGGPTARHNKHLLVPQLLLVFNK
jgi:hypothetical protein